MRKVGSAAIRVVVVVSCLVPAAARAGSVDFEPWRWIRFTTESGLPSNYVTGVVEGDAGSVWAYTYEGLARYDGYRWRRVALDPAWPEPGTPAALLRLDSGEVLLTSRGTVCAVDGSAVPTSPPLPAGYRLVGTAPAPGGLLLALHPEEGKPGVRFALWRDDLLEWIPLPPRAQPTDGAYLCPAGRTPFALTSHGIYRWDGDKWFSEFPAERWIRPSHIAGNVHGDAITYIAFPPDLRGLWELPAGPAPAERIGLDHGPTDAAALAANGDAVVFFDSGAVRVRRDGVWEEPTFLPASMRNVSLMRFRANGDLWVGAETGLYLHRASATGWSRWRHPGDTGRNRVHDLLQSSDGSMWLATGHGVEIRRPDGRVEWIESIDGQELDTVTALAEDPAGHVWVGSGSAFSGAFRWDGTAWTHVGPEQGLPAPRVHKIHRDREGALWFLTLDATFAEGGAGAFRYRDGQGFERFSIAEGLIDDRVLSFAEAPDGTRWFGTNRGLSRLRDGEWAHWNTGKQGLRGDRVDALAVTPDGRLWVGQHGPGLAAFDGERFHYFSRADGLAGDEVWGLAVDRRGWLWITSRGGLSLFRDGILTSLRSESRPSNPIRWPILPLRDRVYIGTLGMGTEILDLAGIDRMPPRIEFEDPLRGDGLVRLHWHAYARWGDPEPEAIRTRHRLDGGAWSRWSTERELTLHGIAPGEHAVEVQALGLLGDFSTEGARLAFQIPLPPWRQPPFLVPIVALLLISVALGGSLLHRRRRDARELQRSERRYRELVENANDLLFTLDVEGRLTSFNRTAEQVLGRSREETRGHSLTEYAAPGHAERIEELLRDARFGRTLRVYDVELTDRDGRRVCLEVGARPAAGGGVQCIARDVTERRDLARQLRQAQKMEAIGRLAGGMAHDFNNILMAVTGYSDLLLHSLRQDVRAKGMLEHIRRAGRRGASLTRQLLAFSRKQVLQPVRLDCNALLGEMEDMLRRLIGEDIRLELATDPDLGCIEADPGQLQQILLNLASNARDAMPSGGRLVIETRSVSLGAGSDPLREAAEPGSPEAAPAPGAYCRISVSDDGCGMDAETVSRAFEPFFTTKRAGRGTGLGLASVYGIVKQSGGHIAIASSPGRGSVFTIYFPEVEGEPAVTTTTIPEATADDARRGTVLVVEDDPTILTYLTGVLRQEGHEVLEAGDGVKGCEAARRHDGAVDLVVTDVVMPNMGGPEMVAELREARPGLPALYVSGYADREPAPSPDPAARFLRKPFRTAELLRIVGELLESSATPPPPPNALAASSDAGDDGGRTGSA